MALKTWMFILGIVALVVSIAGILVILGYTFAFLDALPTNPVLYLGVDAAIGLFMLILSIQRNIY